MVKLSAFADEISPELDEQIECLKKNGVGFIELRSMWGKNVMKLTDAEIKTITERAKANGIGFSAVGSPIGKFPLDGDFNEEIESVKRAIDIARALDCRYIRMFSYFIPKGVDAAKHRDQCVDQVAKLAEICEPTGIKCALENEKGIFGDTGDRFLDILRSVNSSALVGVFDPANFVQCGQRPYQDCWLKVKPYIEYFHIKDARLGSGSVVPAGDGDGDIPMILSETFNDGFDNFLTLEPHLKLAAASYGETGPELFGTAVSKLRKVLKDIGVA
jgi:3-dehydroshikimate dehydratase